jgi:phosphatidylinositol glycan class U
MLAFAFLLQLSLSSILLLAPLLLLLVSDPVSHLASPRPFSSHLRKTAPLLGEFIAYSTVLVFASTLVSGSWAWVPQTWGVRYVCATSLRLTIS